MPCRHLRSLDDLEAEEIRWIIDQAVLLKQGRSDEIGSQHLREKNIALIFEKPSARTRVSFEVGIAQLGGRAMFIQGQEIGIGKRESVSDISKTFSRFVDGVVFRSKKHQDIVDFSAVSRVPVVNALSDRFHPCQALADCLTIVEKKGNRKDIKISYIGDFNNVSRSLAVACQKMGFQLVISCPEKYLDDEIERYGVEVEFDPVQAVKRTDVIYTDVWTSMGDEAEFEQRCHDFRKYRVTQEMIRHADSQVIFMHCLPAHREQEVAGDVIDGPHSVVFDQAENRLHVQKAVLAKLFSADEGGSL